MGHDKRALSLSPWCPSWMWTKGRVTRCAVGLLSRVRAGSVQPPHSRTAARLTRSLRSTWDGAGPWRPPCGGRSLEQEALLPLLRERSAGSLPLGLAGLTALKTPTGPRDAGPREGAVREGAGPRMRVPALSAQGHCSPAAAPGGGDAGTQLAAGQRRGRPARGRSCGSFSSSASTRHEIVFLLSCSHHFFLFF